MERYTLQMGPCVVCVVRCFLSNIVCTSAALVSGFQLISLLQVFLVVDSLIVTTKTPSYLATMGFPIRRMFVVSVSLFYIYMGVCTVSPILNSSLHSELVSDIILHFLLFILVDNKVVVQIVLVQQLINFQFKKNDYHRYLIQYRNI